jgi:DNA-binding transcriptional regulator of glucitol operon
VVHVRQLVLSPRWIMWHLLTLGAMVTCGWLAVWQWQRAGSAMGSALNVGYGLQWPVFALFFGYMWWRMLRMESARLHDEQADVHQDALEIPEPRVVATETGPQVARAAAPADGPSPFGPRPVSVTSAAGAEDDPELADYNRMLAELAARHTDD